MQAMVIIAGTDIYHELVNGGLALQKTLIDAGIATRLSVGMQRFHNPLPATASSDVCIIYSNGQYMTLADQQALAQTIEEGKGLVVLHASNVFVDEMASLEHHHTWFNLVGSRFKGHAAFTHLSISIKREHPITTDIPDFEIDDEPYEIELLDQSAEILATRSTPDGGHPSLYVREQGNGRICYLALGHDMRAWGHPLFRKLLVQAVFWCGRQN
jgi:type 1 glutamine amidotransferase